MAIGQGIKRKKDEGKWLIFNKLGSLQIDSEMKFGSKMLIGNQHIVKGTRRTLGTSMSKSMNVTTVPLCP